MAAEYGQVPLLEQVSAVCYGEELVGELFECLLYRKRDPTAVKLFPRDDKRPQHTLEVIGGLQWEPLSLRATSDGENCKKVGRQGDRLVEQFTVLQGLDCEVVMRCHRKPLFSSPGDRGRGTAPLNQS